MEYEVVISVYPKGQKDAEPVREEILLETADLAEATDLVEEVLDLVEEDDDAGELEAGEGVGGIIPD